MHAALTFLAESSAQAALLALLLLIANRFLLRRIPARGRHLMWALVALRLIVPPILPTDFGILPSGLTASRTEKVGAAPAEMDDTSKEVVSEIQQQPAPESPVPIPAEQETIPASAGSVIFSVWLAGVLVMLTALARNSLRHHARCRHATPLTDADTLALLESCKRVMGVRSDITLFECGGVTGPALCGILRPRIILPTGMNEAITREELRHVILHELAHLRRRDVPVNCACALLVAAHWFNPLIRIAFARMRGEQEIACDEAALAALGSSGRTDYGRTLIKLSGYISTPTPTFGMVGLGTDKQQLKERILMIKRWNNGSKSLPGALALVLALGAALLTEACTHAAPESSDKAHDSGTVAAADADDAKDTAGSKSSDADRFVKKIPLADRKCILVVSEGEFEPRSVGSYTVKLFSDPRPEDSKQWENNCDELAGAITRPRDGSIVKVSFVDINGDGKQDLVVQIECAGTGSYMSYDAYAFEDNRLRLIASLADLDPHVDGVKQLTRKASKIAKAQ